MADDFSSGWYSRGYLPHRDVFGQRQFITYRLADSLPADVIARLRAADSSNALRETYHEELDAAHGSCVLRDPEVARIVVDNWEHHDGSLYRLRDYVVMPNHVHVDIEQFAKLRRITQAWKSYTSKAIGDVLELPHAQVWQPGYFDRYHRDAAHSFNVMCYIYLNPVRAGLVDDPFDWEFSSIHRHDQAMKHEIARWYDRWRATFHACG